MAYTKAAGSNLEWTEEDMMNYDLLKEEMKTNKMFKGAEFKEKLKKIKKFNEK